MDGNVFDAVTKSFAARSRRSLLKTLVTGLIGGGLATLAESEVDAASCRAPGVICREHANCCSDVCGGPDRFGRRRCECQTEADCLVPSNKCKLPICANGTCTTTAVTCTASDQCHVPGTCDPTTGVCSDPPAPNNTPCDDGDICTAADTCQDGVCTSGVPLPQEGEGCGDVVPCCGDLICADGLCCASGRSCSGPNGENAQCCPNASDICTPDGACCSAEKACFTGTELICCDEFTVCTDTGQCCAHEASCPGTPEIGPFCCFNADDVCTSSGFCCPPESLCVVGNESTCCPLPDRACPSLNGTSCSCCGFDETCIEGSCVFGDG